VYQGLFYIADSSNAEYFDPSINIWTTWPAYPTPIINDACLILWEDSFLLIDSLNLQTFDLETETWTTKPNSPVLPIAHPDCLTLPNKKILIVGSGGSPILFDPLTNTWITLPPTVNNQGKVSLLQLGRRYYIFGGSSTETVAQEFNYHTNTWSSVAGGPLKTTNSQGYASVVAVHANLFANLPGDCT
jgi:hypothetical protein